MTNMNYTNASMDSTYYSFVCAENCLLAVTPIKIKVKVLPKCISGLTHLSLVYSQWPSVVMCVFYHQLILHSLVDSLFAC